MRKKDKDLLIIIPAYNEVKNIPTVLDQLEEPEIKKIADILVMDDASSDGTGQMVREWVYRVKVGVIDDEKTA